MTSPKIIYQDKFIVAIDKPSGWVTLYSDGRPTLLQKWLRKEGIVKEEEKKGEFKKRTGIIHRLDRDTSGVLLVAKAPTVLATFRRLFKERKIKKEYLALVRGKTPRKGEIKAPIKRERDFWRVAPGGRMAITKFSCLNYLTNKKGEEFSFLKIRILTGRTHQIRVHFRYLGYPLVGDKIYGSGKESFPRLFLHAFRLSFFHPFLKRRVTITSPLPEELQKWRETLKVDKEK